MSPKRKTKKNSDIPRTAGNTGSGRNRLLVLFGFAVIAISLLNLASILWLWSTPLPDDPSKIADGKSASSEESERIESTIKELEQGDLPAPLDIEFESTRDALWDRLVKIETVLPYDHRVYHVQGLYWKELKQTEKAFERLEKSLSLKADVITVRLDLAKLMLQSGKEEDILELLGRPDATNANNLDYWEVLTESQMRLGNLDLVRELAVESLSSFPSSAKQWYQLGSCQFAKEDWKAARNSLEKSVAIDPANESTLSLLIQVLTKMNETEHAAKATNQLSHLIEQRALRRESFEVIQSRTFREFVGSTYRSTAVLYSEKGLEMESQSALLQAIAINPSDTFALSMLASSYRKQQRYKEAQSLCQLLARLQPLSMEAMVNLASVSLELGDAITAEASLRLAVRRALPDAEKQLADFLALKGSLFHLPHK